MRYVVQGQLGYKKDMKIVSFTNDIQEFMIKFALDRQCQEYEFLYEHLNLPYKY